MVVTLKKKVKVNIDFMHRKSGLRRCLLRVYLRINEYTCVKHCHNSNKGYQELD